MLIGPFLKLAKAGPELPCLYRLKDERWICYSRDDVVQAAMRLCAKWQADGLQPGDRLLILMENRPEWAVTAIASCMYGLVSVPAYTTHKDHEVQYLIEKSDVVAAAVSDGPLHDLLQSVVTPGADFKLYVASDAEKRLFPDIADGEFTLVENREPDGIYALIATSGTNGLPKLVALTQRNLQANVTSILDVLKEADLDKPHRFLSFLPLAHAYEHMAGLYLPLYLGGEIFYCEKLDKLSSMMAEVSPTLMTAVPRLYELLHSRITNQIEKESRIKRLLFETTIRLGQKPQLSFVERLLDGLCERLVRHKVRQRFGGKLRYFVSGGAALNPKISEFFQGLGVGILQGYGQTEASPVISVNRPGAERADTVGPQLPGVEVRLSDGGELLVRGENVMSGYWNDPKSTAEVLIDGWLHTGDLAEIDPDGHIRIVGRLKDLIVNSGGDNIAPAPIEQEISLYPEVEQAVVVGDARPWLSAIVCLNEEIESARHDQVLRDVLRRYNQDKSPVLQIRKALVMAEPCSIDNGLLTPTHKIRRPQVIALYGPQIDQLYSSKSL
jgi:long-chain acyl-CoA synthetase